MLDIIKILVSVMVILLLVELFNLPEWIVKRFRGDMTNKEIMRKIKALENRIKRLEEKEDEA
ncbi:MAG: hypothetical protein GX175_01015 [Halanaerobiaceae bacterium]|jgi:hypothetical protein|nr:hypothetical protein [Halanaerobiaceae bacterium]